jgi:hypothetical protein
MPRKTLTIRQRHDDWTECFQPISRDLLRRDMFLERMRVDTAILSCEPIRRQRVVRA